MKNEKKKKKKITFYVTARTLATEVTKQEQI